MEKIGVREGRTGGPEESSGKCRKKWAAVGFEDLNLIEPLLRAIRDEGYLEPMPIQVQAIPHVLAGRDLMGCAQTGTGKTAAFALPILQRLCTEPRRKHGHHVIRVLVLTPTRELATQIGDSFAAYGRHTDVRHTVIFGGVKQGSQTRALHNGVDVLVATPGRLLDLMGQNLVHFGGLEVFVLDEADRMLDMGWPAPWSAIRSGRRRPRRPPRWSRSSSGSTSSSAPGSATCSSIS